MKQRLYQKLSNLQSTRDQLESNDWATGQGIYESLTKIFGDEVHIIHPDLSSIDSPASNDGIIGAINYIKEIEELIRIDRGNLQKPIIAIWNTASIRQTEDRINLNAKGGSHWQTLVILPKHYTKPNGEALHNEHELILFKDSLYPDKTLPLMIKLLFKEKFIFPRDLRDGEIADNPIIEIGGMLKEATLLDERYSSIIQQEEGYDCGWWAIYNAFMFIMEGNGDFLEQFTAPSRILGYKLRQIFSHLGLNPSEENDAAPQKVENHNYDESIKLAIKNSLIDLIKQKYPTEYDVESSFIKDLSHHYLAILVLLSESAESLTVCCDTLKEIMIQDNKISLPSPFTKKSSNEPSAIDVPQEKDELVRNLINGILNSFESYFSTHTYLKINYLDFLKQMHDFYSDKAEDVALSNREELKNEVIYQLSRILVSYKNPDSEHISSFYDFKKIISNEDMFFQIIFRKELEDLFSDFYDLVFETEDGTKIEWFISGTKSIILLLQASSIDISAEEIFQEVQEIVSSEYNLYDERQTIESLITHAALGEWIEVKKLIEGRKQRFSFLPKEEGSEMDIFHWAADNIHKTQGNELEALFWVVDYFLKQDFLPTYDNYACTAIHHLAYYKETESSLLLMRKLLEKVKSEDINSYDGYGKTPLLEAIETGNNIAKFLIEHRLVDINLGRIEVWKPLHQAGYYTPIGYSPYKASIYHKRTEIAQGIFSSRKYRADTKFYHRKTIYDYDEYISRAGSEAIAIKIAASGNVDSMKMLIRSNGAVLFSSPDTSTQEGWNLLYIACFEANIPIIELLLNKHTIDQILGLQKLTDSEFSEFINYRFNGITTALGRLCSGGTRHATKFNQIVRLFIDCPYVDVNSYQDLSGKALLHHLVEESNAELIIALVQKPYSPFVKKVNFMVKDILGNTPLRLACNEEKIDVIKLFIKLKRLGIEIDFNEFGNKMPISEALRNYAEESWFGESINILNLNIDHLIEVYRTGEPHQADVIYDKEIFRLHIDCKNTALSPKLRKRIEHHIELCFEEVQNYDETSQLESIYPDWYDETLGEKIYKALSTIENEYSSEDEESFLSFKQKEFTITIDDIIFSIKVTHQYTAPRHDRKKISYENLLIPERYDYKRYLESDPAIVQEIKEKALLEKHEPLLHEVCKSENRELVTAFAECEFLNLNPLIPGLKELENADDVSKEMKRILQNAAIVQQNNLKKLQNLLQKLKKNSRNLPDIYQKIVEDAIAKAAERSIREILRQLKQISDEELKPLIQALLKKSVYDVEFSQKLDELLKIARTKKRKEILTKIGEIKGALKIIKVEKLAYQFASEFAHNLALCSYVPRSKDLLEQKQNRRLDSLAYILEGEDVCTAVCFDGRKVFISSNKFPNSSESQKSLFAMTMNYLGQIALSSFNEEEKIQVRNNVIFQSCKLSRESISEVNDKYLKEIISNLNIHYGVWNQKLKFKASEKKFSIDASILECFKSISARDSNFSKLIEDAVLTQDYAYRILRTIISIRKLENAIVHNVFEESFIQALIKQNFEIVGNEEGVHAEMKILHHFLESTQLDMSRNHYIGISMLCCSHCNFVLNYAYKLREGLTYYSFDTRGAHGFGYKWPVPSFVKERFAILFSHDVSLVETFQKLYVLNLPVAIALIEEIFNFMPQKLEIEGFEGLNFFLALETIKKEFRQHRALPSISIADAAEQTESESQSELDQIDQEEMHEVSSLDDKSLRSVDKYILRNLQISLPYKFIQESSVQRYLSFSDLTKDIQISDDKILYNVVTFSMIKFLHQTIILLPELSHIQHHKENIQRILYMVNYDDILSATFICLERKQQGNYFGMPDVIALANYLEQGNALPTELQKSPIYHDALLYNAARAKGIQVIGIEGKGLAYPKGSPYYQQAREEYMAEQLLAIARSGKNAIFLVGSAHINNLIKLLDVQGFRVDNSDGSLGQNLITLRPDQSILTRELALPDVSVDLVKIANYEHRVEGNLQLKTENLEHEKAVQSYFFISYIYDFAKQLDLNWQLKKLLHLTDLAKYESLKAKYGITASFDAFRGSNSDFRKSVLLKLHPDKNPGNPDCNGDFIFVTNLREELNKPFDVQKYANEKIQAIQTFIYKANIWFKAFDTAIDTARLINVPTIDNAKKVLINGAHIYSMHSGINGVSTIINGADLLYKVYQEEYTQALTQGLTTAGYMLAPAAISFVAIPYVGFIYGVTLTIYSGYGAITNAYSFYQEYYEENSGLKSITAYKNLFETLSYSPLQYAYDFTPKSKEYEVKLNNIKLELEKAYIKDQLETKGEFGQKLYEYIYSRIIDKKYNLQNNLKAKYIKVMDYDHCMEVMELKGEQSDHYYCYNEAQQILDHVVIIGNTYVEKIGSL